MRAPAPEEFAAYLPRTRWFAGKGRDFRVASVREIARLAGAGGSPVVAVHLVTVAYDDAAGGSEVYQVPLSWYPEAVARVEHALVSGHEGWSYDAVHDREAMALWLDAFASATPEHPSDVPGMRFFRADPEELADAGAAAPLTGEQSNSSVRFGDRAIMKLFRTVTPGENPDIEIHRALTVAGSDDVAPLYGWITSRGAGEPLRLGMIQEYLRTATDGFELAMSSVRAMIAEPGGDPAAYAGEAAELGRAVARIHARLAEAFGSEERGPEAAAALADAMRQRLDEAILAVPELDAHAPRIRGLFARVAELSGLRVQRVHGDLHLGQSLRTSRGWRIVDFEGEPARPLADRLRPDSPWRDVAGMLRSFDYAPGVVRLSPGEGTDGEEAAAQCAAWAATARAAFLAAYAEEAGAPGAADALLVDAYVADKAVYEAVYEARNRPTWIAIPLEAIARLGHEEETA
ncbi:maltokinase N-terminal cap-like domain-containing protein [Microbacterium excoecariae]|uniref:maltokinase N-terminal cap-like domain-containing protein n=1 Tax=Microbacterium excoecariae TaxID=2715210 RepID=UPI00140AEB0C|nr:phosphotransferase [Microbacterium excoecariae]